MPDRSNVALIRKQTEPQASDGSGRINFVLSTDTRDLAGDEIVQQGLSLARDPLPAQIDHGGGLFDIIGQWRNVRFGQHKTTATLELLDRGVNRAADLVRDLYAAGVQLAASIGFVPEPGAYELIRDPNNDRVTGIRWLRAVLTEASVVVTPANPEALALSKALHPSAAPSGQPPADGRDAILRRLLGATAPAAAGITQKRTGTHMTIAEQIRAAEAALNALKDKQLAATNALADATEDEARAALVNEMETTSKQIEAQERTIAVLKTTEQQIAARATPVAGAGLSAVTAPASAPAIIRAEPRATQQQKCNLLIRAALVHFESHVKRVPATQIIEERYGRDPLVEAVRAAHLLTQVKAAQNPAMTSVPEWAGALVRDGYGAFMEDLQRESVVPQLPLQSESFNGFNSITIAARTSDPTADPNLAAAFRAEGAPIRVGSVQIGAKKLTPKSMGIIGTWTLELWRRSTPNIEQKIHDWMIEDTAIKLDTIFLGTGAGTPIQPAGIANNLAAGDTAVSTGNTAAAIAADIRARVQALYGHGLGKRPVWIMNPKNLAGIAYATTAAGTPAFPSAAGPNPAVGNIPVVTSITVPLTTVYLVDAAEIAFAGGTPEFLASDIATIHEEYDAAAVKPLVDAGATPTVASPQRSFFQTASAGLRALWEVDWLVLRAGAVQTITGVNW